MVWYPEFLVIMLGPIRTMWLPSHAVISRSITLFSIDFYDSFGSAESYLAFQYIVHTKNKC